MLDKVTKIYIENVKERHKKGAPPCTDFFQLSLGVTINKTTYLGSSSRLEVYSKFGSVCHRIPTMLAARPSIPLHRASSQQVKPNSLKTRWNHKLN